MSTLAGSKALLVLGMHRSGTSCLARVVNLLGAQLGTALVPPGPDNPLGFWEHAGIAQLHEEILHRIGGSWQSGRPLPFEWWRRPELDDLRERARQIVEGDFAGEAFWALKDPRLCRLLPFWQPILSELGCDTRYLILTRDPREVAASLLARDAIPWWRSDLLWLRHVLAAERDTRGACRAYLRYSDLLANWRAALDAPAKTLEIALPEAGSAAEAEIDRFVSADQRHQRPESVLGWPITPWARAVYAALDPAADGCESEIQSVLDRVTGAVEAADVLYGPWRDSLEDEIGQSKRNLQQNEIDLREATQSCAVLAEALEQQRIAVAANSGRLEESRRQAEQRLEWLSAQRDELLERLGARKSELERVRSHCDELANELAEAGAAHRQAANHASELEQVVARLDEDGALRAAESQSRIASLSEELSLARRELDHESLELRRILASRSWRMTAPLRTTMERLRKLTLRRQQGLDPSDLVPWLELLPDAAFRQRFRSPIDRLRGLGIGFFTYCRINRTSVAVRVLEEQRFGRSPRLLAESVLRDDEIQDGQLSRVIFERPIESATRRRLLIEVASLDGLAGQTVTVALARPYYRGRVLVRGGAPEGRVLAIEFDVRQLVTRKTFAFISGCPGDAYRYRCQHQAEMLAFRGYGVDVLPPDVFPWKRLLQGYQVVVAHRVPHTPEFEAFVDEARRLGVRVVFDTDDLVFDPAIADHIAALAEMDEAGRELYLNGVLRYRAALRLCEKVTVSTDGLAKAVTERCGVPVFVSRNRTSDQMWSQARAAEAERPARGPGLRLAYLSGTRTHKRDFAECVPALARLLDEQRELRLLLVGHIDPPPELARHRSRIEQRPLVAWQELPGIYASIDINLAPLERGNEFTEGKSELKYIEAGLLGVPTVASAVGGYRAAIRDGENGFLCSDEQSWLAALRRLVEDESLRRKLGENARQDVLARYQTRSAAAETVEIWRQLLGHEGLAWRRLSIAFVVRAPIASTGGGYKKIFQLVDHLSRRGHLVRVYVEPIAHLQGLSEAAIRAFCQQHFDCGEASIVVGHDEIAECDVAVATNWPTAAVVDELPDARLRLYFIQDYEPEFYEEGDPLRQAAEATYDRRLLIVGIGGYLAQRLGERNGQPYPHIDFALAPAFFEGRDEVEAKLEGLAAGDAPAILFFARPEIPRRGFELGVEALTRLHEKRPDVAIRLYGMREERELPFPYEQLGVLGEDDVAREMRRAAIHLSFSRTNASTVIFEAMASGCAAIDLAEPGVTGLIEDSRSCALVEATPDAVARALIELAGDPVRIVETARAGEAATKRLSAESMCRQFEELLLRHSLRPDADDSRAD